MSLDCRSDRAVSPVIAVILMVAIVVVLAAVVGGYALNFGDETVEPAPNVRLDAVYDERTDANGQYLNVTVQGGETVPIEELTLDVDGATDDAGSAVDVAGDPLGSQVGTELATADTFSLDQTSFGISSGHLDLSDATVTIVWNPDPDAGDPGQTQNLWSWEDD